MESIFGMENMSKDATHVRMNQVYEEEILAVSKVSNMVRQIGQIRPVWYGPILARLGDVLVSSGTRLKTYYSIQHAYRAR
jgi:hypothetical protein